MDGADCRKAPVCPGQHDGAHLAGKQASKLHSSTPKALTNQTTIYIHRRAEPNYNNTHRKLFGCPKICLTHQTEETMAASQTHVNEDRVTLNTSVVVRIEYLVHVTLNESDRRGNGRMPNYSPLLAMALCCPTNNWHKLFLDEARCLHVKECTDGKDIIELLSY